MCRTVINDRAHVNDIPSELNRIYDLIHDANPTGPELCWLQAPCRTHREIVLTWLPAMDVNIPPEGIIHEAVAKALRQLACDLLSAALRIERASR